MFPFQRGRAVCAAGSIVLLIGQGQALGGSDAPAGRAFELVSGPAGAGTLSVDLEALGELTRRGPVVEIDRFPLSADMVVDLRVRRFSVTGPETRFVLGAQEGDDAHFDFDPDRVTLLRGQVVGEPDSHVFMAISEWGSIGRIELGSAGPGYAFSGPGTTLRIGRADESPGSHPGSLSPDLPFCGTDASLPDFHRPPPLPAGVPLPEVTQQVELAVETDYELFSLFGTLEATCAYVLELYGAVSDIYLRDVNVRVDLTFVRLWDDPDDLFNSDDPIFEFYEYWEKNMTGVQRDAAQFCSGRRNFPYGGAAFLKAFCDFAYGVCGYINGFVSDPNGPPTVFGYDVHVTAHEFGHNCAAFHTPDYGIDTCDDLLGEAQRSTIMSYCSQTRSGGNGNTDLRIHSIIQDVMRAHLFSVSCLVNDCNGNGVDDDYDILLGDSADVNGNGIADECEDCNGNGTLDPEDIMSGDSDDDNNNGVPDECEPDCNGNGQPDDLDILLGVDTDLYGDNVPDGCEADCNGNGTSDYTDIQADMSLDIDRNAILDACQDCDDDGTNDFEALAGAHNTWVASSVVGTGIAEFHAVAGVRSSLGTAGVLDNPQDLIITADGRILVSSADDDRVAEFDGDGIFVGDLVSAGSGGLDYPAGMAIGPNGNLFVASRDTNSVLEYNASSGAFQGVFVSSGSGGLFFPWGIAFGPNGNLFVTSVDSVIEYDGTSGALVGDFVTAADNGGLADARGILFKPDGALLVASLLTDQILEYDAASGAFIDQFNNGGTSTVLTLDEPWTLRLGPDGDVYASRHDVSVGDGSAGGHHDDDIAELHVNSTRIYIFDVDSGIFVRSYVTGHDTELSFPTAFDFMPGDATDCNFNLIPDPCDIASGTSRDANGNGTPDECEAPCPGDVNGDGQVGINDFLDLLAAWGPNPGHPADLDGDDEVGISDFLMLLANWGPC